MSMSSADLRFLLMWILAWLTATPVRVVRAALRRVEHGDLRGDLVVFDGTELGELQRGFNAMVDGLRERERVRDLFGRHVGREVALAAERDDRNSVARNAMSRSCSSTWSAPPTGDQPTAAEVVELLNRFFGIVSKRSTVTAGWSTSSRATRRWRSSAPRTAWTARGRGPGRGADHRRAAGTRDVRVSGRIGVAAGQVVAGNVGAKERFEYTVIGEPVNEAARLCELAKSHPGRLLATADTLVGASENERARWSLGDTVTLRGHDRPTRLAFAPVETADPKPGVRFDFATRAGNRGIFKDIAPQRDWCIDIESVVDLPRPRRCFHRRWDRSRPHRLEFVDRPGCGSGNNNKNPRNELRPVHLPPLRRRRQPLRPGPGGGPGPRDRTLVR